MKPASARPPIEPPLETAVSWTVRNSSRKPLPALGAQHSLLWAYRLEALWRLPLLNSKSSLALLLLLIAAVCALRAWIGMSGFQAFSWDAFMPLDGAWRVLNGQRPHIDFYSFMGVLVYLPTALGLLVSHGGAEGFAYGQALVGFFLGLWALLLSRKRLPDVPALLFCLAIVLLVTAPFPLGHSPLSISPATTYNRYGYAALALILLEAVLPRRRPGTPREFWGGTSTGALLVLLFFLKITFFLAAVFLLGALAFCRPQTARRWAGIGAGFSVVALAFCSYFGFRLLPMFHDLAMVAGAKRIHFRIYLLDSILADIGTLLCFTAVAALLLARRGFSRSAQSLAIAGAAVCFTGTLLIFGNSEPHGAPLALFFILIAVGRLTVLDVGAANPGRCGFLLCGSVFALASLAPSALGFAYAAVLSAQAARHEVPMAAPALAKFIPSGFDAEYRALVNDGLALVRQNRTPGDTVMSLEFSNPFSYGLGMKPARGGTVTLDYLTTFNDAHRPTAEWLFGAANLVMVPKVFIDPALANSVPRLYGPYLASHFHLIGESRNWRIYRLN